MIDLHRAGLALLFSLALITAGCGGCQDEDRQPAPLGQGAPSPAALGEATTAPPPPTKAGPPPLPTTIQEGEGEEDQEAAVDEDDCFVMMDAFPDYGAPPLKVKFTSEVECNSGKPTFKWDFGDGSAGSTEANPTHTYSKEGEFVASVTVTGPSGGTDTDEMDVVVEKDAKPE